MSDSPSPSEPPQVPPIDPHATVALKAGVPKEALSTVKIPQGLDLPGVPAPARRSWWPWAVGGLVAAGLVVAVWVWNARTPVTPQEVVALPSPPAEPSEVQSPEVRAMLKEAEGGNVRAMHTLALWHYYGLNVPKDRDKGLQWYRRAAAAGSAAAKQELAQIENGQR